MCLVATKFVLRKINSGVWFIQTFLQKMLYMPNFPHTSSTVNMQIMNQFHTHSQKKQNPAKKFIKSGQIEIAQQRRRWDRAVKARSVQSSDERCDRRGVRSTSALIGWSRCSSIDERARNRDQRGARSPDERAARRSPALSSRSSDDRAPRRSPTLSSSSLSLRSGLSLLSLSLSLSLFPEMIWTENKSVKLFPGQRSKYWSTGNEFGNEFPENFIFCCSQTCGFRGKWFPEIIFTRNKRTNSEKICTNF